MGILDTIGKTEVINLEKSGSKLGLNLYAKLEFLNPGGSIKDRTSVSILQHALKEGCLNPNSTVIESSSGNMAVGLAQFCLYHKINLIIVVDPFALSSNVQLIKTYGAKVITIDTPCPVTGWLGARIKKIHELHHVIPDAFWPNQYENTKNPDAHYHTMKEFNESLDQPLDYLFISTSTCGTLMGCSQYINEHLLPTKIVAVDAVGSVIFSSKSGKRKIPGHGASRPSRLLDKTKVHHVIHVADLDCVEGCHRLLQEEAILAGGSTGGVYHAISKFSAQLPPMSRCGMMVCDRGERYMETIYNQEWVERNLRSTVQNIEYAA